EILSIFPVNTEKRYLRIMKLLTMNFWNRADGHLRLSVPKLFQSPYFTKLEQGLTKFYLSLNSENPDQYEVTQVKTYGVYPRKLTDLYSDFPEVDKNRLLVNLPISWSARSPEEERWPCSLKILNTWEIKSIATEKESEYLSEALKDFIPISKSDKERLYEFV